MKKSTNITPMGRTDKLCAVLLLGAFLTPHLAVWAMDEATIQATEADKPPAITITAPPIDCTALVETIEAHREAEQAGHYDQAVPLDQNLQDALWETCEANGVPVCLALGLIETESNFQVDAVSSEGCYGLCQLNPRWFPADLDPAGNIRAGVAYLGTLLEMYDGDTSAALTAYNTGTDTGKRTYARAVLAAAEKWGCG